MQVFLTKKFLLSSQKYGLDPGTEIREKLIPDPGVEIAPDPGSAPLVWRLCFVQYSWIDRLGPPQKVKGDILRRLNIRPSQARNLPIFLHARYAGFHTSPYSNLVST